MFESHCIIIMYVYEKFTHLILIIILLKFIQIIHQTQYNLIQRQLNPIVTHRASYIDQQNIMI